MLFNVNFMIFGTALDAILIPRLEDCYKRLENDKDSKIGGLL